MERKIKFKITFLILLICFFWVNLALALSLPLPPNTKVIREEVVEAAGQDKQVTFCESDLNEEQVSAFYRKQLESRGYSIFMQQKNLGVYLKGQEMFMVMIGPPSGTAKTSVILTTTKMDTAGMPAGPQVCEDIPSIPVYPGAQCLGSMRMKNMRAISAKYSVSAELENVLGFYRSQMLKNGWTLEQEKPMAQYMPKQALSDMTQGGGLNLEGATLMVFKNLKDERGMITLMPAIIGQGTLINITYEEKK